MSHHIILITLCLLATSLPAAAQNSDSPSSDAWRTLQSLIGQWDGDSAGQPGQGPSGSFTVASELQGRALVRRSFAEFPATQGRPAVRHDDLTIVYQGEPGAAPRATYYDSEGHAIEYSVSASPDGSRIEWLSALRPDQPRFRVTYIFTSPTTMKVRFEIAPPGQPDKFSTHVEGSVHRAGTK